MSLDVDLEQILEQGYELLSLNPVSNHFYLFSWAKKSLEQVVAVYWETVSPSLLHVKKSFHLCKVLPVVIFVSLGILMQK